MVDGLGEEFLIERDVLDPVIGQWTPDAAETLPQPSSSTLGLGSVATNHFEHWVDGVEPTWFCFTD